MQSTGGGDGNSNVVPSLKDLYGASYAGQNESNKSSKLLDMIGAGWKDSSSTLKDAKGYLASMKSDIGKIPTLRDKYKEAAKGYLEKTKEAIAGNKQLIQSNQKESLEKVADDVKKNIFGTNINLGVLGASNSSAARRFAKVLGKKAGQERKEKLEGYGTQTAEQNQAERDETDRYTLRIQKADEWHDTQLKAAKEEYKRYESAISKLSKNADKWEQEDLKAESDANLNKFLGKVAEISGKVATLKQNITIAAQEQGINIDEIQAAEIDVNAPAELQVPDYTEEWNLDGLSDGAQDWLDDSDPNNQNNKDRKIVGYDIFGKPIYSEETTATEPVA